MRLIIKKQPKPSKKLPSNAVQFYDFPEVLQPLQTLHQRHLRSDCVKKKKEAMLLSVQASPLMLFSRLKLPSDFISRTLKVGQKLVKALSKTVKPPGIPRGFVFVVIIPTRQIQI